MKTYIQLAVLFLLTLNAHAQYLTVTNLAGTVAYGSTNVTVTSAGSVSSIPYCGVNPYWIGSGSVSPGSYTFTFSAPRKAVRIYVTAMDNGPAIGLGPDTEKISVFINGSFYTLTSANITVYPGTCGQPTEPTIGGQLVCTLDFGAGGGGQIDINQCGITSCQVWANGVLNGSTFTFQFDTTVCFRAVSNDPCIGDTLFLKAIGDSTGASYAWSGPGGFSSTMQNPFIYPSVWADTGIYTVVRTVSGAHDTSRVHVTIHPLPVVIASNNSPLCAGMTDTLLLSVTPFTAGETFKWSGPVGFTSTMQFPSIPGFTAPDTGTYKVVATTSFGCKDSAYTYVSLVPPPPAITVTGITSYCQGMAFVPFTVTGVTPGATVMWYTSSTGGPGTTTAPVVTTSIPGYYTYWVNQVIGGCESPRVSITVRVITTPPAPLVTGNASYCQFIGPFVPLVVMTTPTSTARWYTTATGGTFSTTEPVPNLSVAGTYNYWVSQIDSGCESPRSPVTITVHPKPAQPTPNAPFSYCQFVPPVPLSVTVSGAGDIPRWYGPGITASGSTTAPTPNSSFAPDTITYYVTEMSSFGCVSDSATDVIIIKLKPQPPLTRNTRYCQHASPVAPLSALVDSSYNGVLNWYYQGTLLTSTPVPPVDTTPGTYTWWVNQTVPATNGCTSDSAKVSVEVVYKPVFSIAVSRNWVCRYDSLQLAYKGPVLFEPYYNWTLPTGVTAVNGTNTIDSMLMLQFDSTGQNNVIHLRAFDDSGFCYSDTSININVIPLPTMTAYTKHDVCLHDTVQLILSTRSANAYDYKWYVNLDPLFSSPAVNVVTSNSNSGGPFLISWVDTGRYVVTVTSTTKEGCKSDPSLDSVEVHGVPDASFAVIATSNGNTLCLDDSVEFAAVNPNYNNTYEWMPSDYFNNDNKPVIWGRLREQNTTITLKVTDPYGCYATKDMPMEPATCCTILFPNAFTPNGSGPVENNVFKPYYTGYHRFHLFRIVNRWGTTVFESANTSDTRWDGTYNGVPQDMGVYYWYIKYDCGGKTMEAKGDVTLIR